MHNIIMSFAIVHSTSYQCDTGLRPFTDPFYEQFFWNQVGCRSQRHHNKKLFEGHSLLQKIMGAVCNDVHHNSPP